MSLQLAEQYEDNEQYNEAYAEYQKLYSKNPKDLNIIERLGHLAIVLNKKDDAADYYSKILEFDATNTMAYEQLMDIYAATDRYKYYVYRGNLHSVEQKLEHAINDYKKALANTQEEKDMVHARFVLATLYEQTGQNMKAIDEYLKVIDYEENGFSGGGRLSEMTPVRKLSQDINTVTTRTIKDGNEEVYLKLANLYLKEGTVSSAIDILERAIKHDVDSDNVRENLAKLYLREGMAAQALELTSDKLTKIQCLLEHGQTKEAFSELESAEKEYKNDGKFHSLKAQYYYTVEDYEKALESVNEFDKFEKNSPLSYQMRALIYENLNNEYNAHLNWGKYNLVRGNKDIAINEFLNSYQLNSSDSNLVNTIAVLLEETGDSNHAMEFYEKLIELEPENKTALTKLADFRENIGDYKLQAEYLEKLYELDKKNSITIKKLAAAYEKLRNKPAALEFYNLFLKFGKGDSDYEKIKQKIDKLNNTDMQEDEGLIDKIMKFFNKA